MDATTDLVLNVFFFSFADRNKERKCIRYGIESDVLGQLQKTPSQRVGLMLKLMGIGTVGLEHHVSTVDLSGYWLSTVPRGIGKDKILYM